MKTSFKDLQEINLIINPKPTSEDKKKTNSDLKCDGQNDECNEMESVLRPLLQCRL